MEFQGFQSEFLPSLIITLALALIILSFYVYRNNKSLSSVLRILLSTLRSITFILLLFLLLNPFYFSLSVEKQNPRLLLLFDNSKSVSINKGVYEGVTDYKKVIQTLIESKPNKVDVDFYTFGNSSNPLYSIDSLTFTESLSNVSSAITLLQELQTDYTAAIIVSDGIITVGPNPIITASKLEIPIFTVGIGDTSAIRDITIKNILTNATGFTNTRHIVDVEILQNGYKNYSTQIQILNRLDEIISERTIQFDSKKSITTERFEIELAEEGLVPFTVNVKNMDGEWSKKNNSQTFTIDILDNKTKILHLSTEIHPDVKFIRSLLSSDPSIELETLTWLSEDRFIEKTDYNLENFDLLIIHGNPNLISDLKMVNSVSDVPTIILDLPDSRTEIIQQNELTLVKSTESQVFEITILPSKSIENHPILEFDEIQLNSLSPLLSSLSTEYLSVDAVALLNIGFQGIDTENPLLAISERGAIRRAHIVSWGWFRLYQSPNKEEHTFVSQLFGNLINWISNNPDNRKLNISPLQSVFNSSEPVIINASLINESGKPEPNATIELYITTNDGSGHVFNLDNLGNGNYSISVESLNTNLYSFTATARKNSRIIDKQTGTFLLKDSNKELIITQRNDELLRGIATETNGRFFTYNKINDFWTSISEADLLKSNTITVEQYHFPIKSISWFFLVIILLTVEWILRKYYSLP